MKENRKRVLRLWAILLAVVILLLDVLFVLIPDKETSQVENRNLQQFPTLSWNKLVSGRGEDELEDYVADQFPFRTAWVRLKSAVDRVMGKTEANNIFLCKNGYLIQNFTEAEDGTTAELAEAVGTFLAAYPDVDSYALIAPTALTVYEDLLPTGAVVGDEDDFIENAYIGLAHQGVVLVDVRDAFQEASNGEQLYYRTDHHWTSAGAYLAYQTFVQRADLINGEMVYTPTLLSDSFQGTLTASSGFRMGETDELYAYLPETETPYVVTYVEEGTQSASCYVTDQLELRDQYTVFFGGNHAQVNIETNADSDRVLLVLKDSYANSFVPFLLGDFREIIMIDPRYYSGDLKSVMEGEEVTDVLFLYNASTLASDSDLIPLLEDQ
jgi:hypothetical protein